MKRWILLLIVLVLALGGCKARTGNLDAQSSIPDASAEEPASALPSQSEPENKNEPEEDDELDESEEESESEPQPTAPLPDLIRLQEEGKDGSFREKEFADSETIATITQLLGNKQKLNSESIKQREKSTTIVAFSEEKNGETAALMVFAGTPASLGEEVTVITSESGEYYTSIDTYEALRKMLEDA